MYTSFFGLNEKPFSITPDPRYLFMSERHTEALAHLVYGVREASGFIQLTGEVGTGKTTLIRSLLQKIPENADVALILNPQLSRNEFLSTICEELGIPLPNSASSVKTLIDALNTYLLNNHGRGRRTVLIVDEAQNLRLDVLEQVRLLTNLETAKQKLLQIILIAQPELRDLLSRTDMRQLAQRITGRYHLDPLSAEETKLYIEHRLKVAGGVGSIFSNAAKRELYRLSSGIPRRINVIADRAMLGAFTRDIHQIKPGLLRKAAAEVMNEETPAFSPLFRWMRATGMAVAFVVIALGLAWAWVEWPRLATGSASNAEMPAPTATTPATMTVEPEPPVVDRPPPDMSQIPAPTVDEPIPAKDLDTILQDNRSSTRFADAFDTLFRIWGVDYVAGRLTACEQAKRLQLYCLWQTGSLAQVRRIDRPVILTLHDYRNQEHKVVLSGLNGDVAVISIAGADHQLAPNELTELWAGQYLLLWRPEFDDLKRFYRGTRNEGVRWLRESLAEIQGKPIIPADSDYFDSALEARVRKYQRDNLLDVDGIVGYQTQIAINADLGSADRPSLARMN